MSDAAVIVHLEASRNGQLVALFLALLQHPTDVGEVELFPVVRFTDSIVNVGPDDLNERDE